MKLETTAGERTELVHRLLVPSECPAYGGALEQAQDIAGRMDIDITTLLARNDELWKKVGLAADEVVALKKRNEELEQALSRAHIAVTQHVTPAFQVRLAEEIYDLINGEGK